MSMRMPKVNLTGNVYGMRKVLSFAGRNASSTALWLCRCQCGSECVVQQGNLLREGANGCSCQRGLRHGMCGTQTYNTWSGMLDRCYNPNHAGFSRYGGAGVTVCPEWRTFTGFLADMGECPSPQHSIDRFPDQKGNYEKSNCRWATDKEQANNKANNRLLEYKGVSRTMAEWADCPECCVSYTTLRKRLGMGWTVEQAMETPARKLSHR